MGKFDCPNCGETRYYDPHSGHCLTCDRKTLKEGRKKSPMDKIELDISISIEKRRDGWWDCHYEAFANQQELTRGNCQGGSYRVVVDSVTGTIRDSTKELLGRSQE